jgi:hypothetical protein
VSGKGDEASKQTLSVVEDAGETSCQSGSRPLSASELLSLEKVSKCCHSSAPEGEVEGSFATISWSTSMPMGRFPVYQCGGLRFNIPVRDQTVRQHEKQELEGREAIQTRVWDFS